MVECEPSKFDAPVRFRHPAQKVINISGCRELNPGLTHPMGKYYRYTTARLYSPFTFSIGAPRIELEPYAPKAYILPLYYAPPLLKLWRASPSSYLRNVNFRSAENRTRVSRTRSVYTTAVLHSAIKHLIMQNVHNQM